MRFKAPLRHSALTVTALALCLTAGAALVGRSPFEATATGATALGSPGPTQQDQPAGGETMEQPPRWDDVERLITEDRLQAASELVDKVLAAARESGDEELWTRALIRQVQLRTALGGFETAVRLLHQQPWPEAPRQQAVLHLFYAHSLIQYYRAYSWEVAQRERVVSEDELDLDAWTRDQIVAAAHASFLAAWHQRRQWGSAPLGAVAEYLEQNDYPPRIRGTLRDAVTYLWVELLADSSLWRAEQENGLYRLPLAELATGGELTGGEEALADPTVHPLRRLSHLSADLESWHRGEERPEAAFEARRERLERLASSFERAEDRALLRGELEAGLERLGRRYAWWSMGMAQLAGWVQREPRPDALVRAREIAREGAAAHPESLGGRRCRYLAATIEAPAYQLAAMALDGPRERSIEISHKNLPEVHFRAYRLDLLAQVKGARDARLLPAFREVPQILAQRSPDFSWSVELPPTPDYRRHRTYVTPPMTDPGLYLVVASARGDFGDKLNHLQAVNLLISDLVLLTRDRGDGSWEVTVRSGETGHALAGVEVSLYAYDYRGGHRRAESRTSGEDGRVTFRRSSDPRSSYFLFARRDEQMALDASRLRFYSPDGQQAESTSALVYTDRSVYRPGQSVEWKAVAYRGRGDDGRFTTLPATPFTVELTDPNGEVVASQQVESNDFGSAAGDFVLPPGRLLGSWGVRTSLGGGSRIQVEEYKRPTFEVEITEPDEALRLNRPVTLSGEARYYFGLPVAGGDVDWQVVREPLYPRWWSWWGWPTQAPVTVAAGSTELAADGTFRVSFTPEADEREAEEGVTYRFRLSAEVTDEGGETRSASRAFRLGFVAVEASLDAEGGFLVAGEAATVTARRSDLDGNPRAGGGRWRLSVLEAPAAALLPAEQPLPQPADPDAYQTAGDRLRPRWSPGYNPQAVLRSWQEGEEVATGAAEHGDDGEASLTLPPLAAGAYRLSYTTEDPFGSTAEAQLELVVAADGAEPVALPALLRLEHNSVAVGETARLLVASGLPDQPLLLELLRDGEPFERRPLTSGAGAQVVEVAVGAEHRGGFGVRLTALADHQLMSLTEQVAVPWDDRRLEIELATFRDRLRPGQQERWRVVVRGADEAALAAGAAELLAYMYDRSLDLFAPHQPPQVADLYPDRRGSGPLRHNLGAAFMAWNRGSQLATLPDYPQLSGDRLKFYDRYGIGGPGRRGGPRVIMRQASPMERMPQPTMALEADVADKAAGFEESVTVSTEGPQLDSRRVSVAGPAGAEDGGQEPAAVELRSDFAETAFWYPQLLLARAAPWPSSSPSPTR